MKDNQIKDSGERTEFASGAVRDMHEGKGDMASVPWEAILRLSKHYENGAKNMLVGITAKASRYRPSSILPADTLRNINAVVMTRITSLLQLSISLVQC